MANPKRTLTAAARRSQPNSGAPPDLECSYDLRGRLLEINEPLEHMLGYSRQEILGANLRELLDPVSWESMQHSFVQQAGGAAPELQKIQIRRKSGELRLLEISTQLVFDKGTPAAVAAAGRDLTPPDVDVLTELHRLSTHKHESMAELFADFLRTGCAIFGLNYGAVLASEAGVAVVAATHGNPLSLRPGVRIPMSAFDRPEGIVALFADLAVCLHTLIWAGAEEYGILSFFGNSSPRRHSFPNPDREILELMSHNLGLLLFKARTPNAILSQHDSLTGLPDRFLLLEVLDTYIKDARARQRTVTLLYVDLDRFRRINDTLGHGAGDRLLIEVAARLRSSVQTGGFAARLGADEFAVVLRNPQSELEAVEASGRLLEILRAPYLIEERELFVTATIGIGFFPEHGENAAELLHTADAAMQRAKRQGRNGVKCFVPNGHYGSVERLELENGLRRALQRSELELNFQPIVSMDGELEGFEVLLGWNHPALGRVSPVRFIPIAEETGLIVPIGQWVLEQACQHGARWIEAGLPLKTISVNVSAIQIAKPNFVETVAAALTATGFPARSLELELTEGVLLRDIEEAIQRIAHLREIGVGVTIDDFGTGYSSLNYLCRLPVAGLKIDQSFLRDIESPSRTFAVVKTIVSLAHHMNLSVVAEGVETLRELELMREAGCDRVQGHLYGRSVNADAARELLARPGRMVPI
jgi:diguanylate cyclase (GGDEF)-like protein/PAS domain S-box-containing protein